MTAPDRMTFRKYNNLMKQRNASTGTFNKWRESVANMLLNYHDIKLTNKVIAKEELFQSFWANEPPYKFVNRWTGKDKI